MHTENVSIENASDGAATAIPGTGKPAPRRVGKAARKPAATAKAKAAASTTASGGIPLKRILSELKLDGKLARRKLRAAKLDFHGHNERWEFTAKQAVRVREILKPSKPVKKPKAKPAADDSEA